VYGTLTLPRKNLVATPMRIPTATAAPTIVWHDRRRQSCCLRWPEAWQQTGYLVYTPSQQGAQCNCNLFIGRMLLRGCVVQKHNCSVSLMGLEWFRYTLNNCRTPSA
jgi:hypothetical protein